MKMVEQDFINNFSVKSEVSEDGKVLVCDYGYGNPFELDTKGALQLIEILKEFIKDKTIPLDYYPEYDETRDYPSDAFVRHNGEVKLAISIKGIY